MEPDDDNHAVTTQMSDMPSGVVMNGLSSGVSSALLGDSFINDYFSEEHQSHMLSTITDSMKNSL